MSFETGVLREDALHHSGDGLDLDVRIGWYRSLPLSCVEKVEVSVGGEQVASEDISLALNGRRFGLDELAAEHEEWWFIQDPAVLHLRGVNPPAGQPVEVKVHLTWRIPYIIIGPEQVLRHSVRTGKDLVAA